MPGVIKRLKNQFTIDTIILKNNADKNPFTKNPGTITDASKIIKAFNTKINRPNVIIVIGNVNKTRIGFNMVFSIPRTIARTKTVIALSTTIPGTMYAATKIDTQLTKRYISNLMS